MLGFKVCGRKKVYRGGSGSRGPVPGPTELFFLSSSSLCNHDPAKFGFT